MRVYRVYGDIPHQDAGYADDVPTDEGTKEKGQLCSWPFLSAGEEPLS
jgi:hypothetical protein